MLVFSGATRVADTVAAVVSAVGPSPADPFSIRAPLLQIVPRHAGISAASRGVRPLMEATGSCPVAPAPKWFLVMPPCSARVSRRHLPLRPPPFSHQVTAVDAIEEARALGGRQVGRRHDDAHAAGGVKENHHLGVVDVACCGEAGSLRHAPRLRLVGAGP